MIGHGWRLLSFAETGPLIGPESRHPTPKVQQPTGHPPLGPRIFIATFGESASRTAAVSIPTSADSDVEGAETYRITLNDTAGYELGADKTADGTLNDSVTVSKPGRPTGLTATAGDKRVVLTWDDPDDDDITGYKLRYAKTRERRRADWNLISGSDADTTTYTVTGLENGAEYSFRILATSAGGDGTASKWVKATPRAAAASVSLSIADASASESVSSGTLSFTVTASSAPSSEVTFKYAVTAESGDTATAGTDFTAVTSSAKGSGSIAANARTTTIEVTLLDDNIEEADETFTVTLSEASGATIADATATGTIENDDTATLSIADPSAVTEGDSGGTDLMFTATLDSQSAQEVTVDYAVDSASTATSGTDHAALADGTLTFPAGTATKTITVSVTGDEEDEPDETVVIKLSNAVNAVLGTATATGTITDDDASPELAAIEDVTLRVGQTVDITASATDADNDAIGYVWSRKAGETTPALPDGTAQNQAQLTFVTAAAGTYTMTVTASDGNGNSDTEEVVITVAEALPVLQLLTNPSAVAEGTDISLTVTSNKALTGTLQVSLTLSDRGSSGFDAADIGGALTQTFTATFGETASLTGTVSIPTVLDSLLDGDDTYTITLNAGTGYELGADKTAEGTLSEGTASVSAPATLTVAEDAGNATVTITTERAFGTATTFSVSYGSTASTSDADATGAANPSDGDYDNDAVTSVQFGASDTTKDIVIPITDDAVAEGAETFTVTIALAQGSTLPAGFALGNAATTVTITDDDASPVLTAIEDVPLRVGQTVDITASATDADDGDTVNYAWSRKAGETTPALPQGTALNQAQLTFVPTATGAYTMTVTASDGNGNSDTEEVVITVTAARTPELALSGTANGEEGSSLSLTLTSDINVADTLDVAFAVQGSVAATDTDAAAADFNGGTLSGIATASFANGKTATVTVPLTDDGDVEGDEGFRIALASGSGYTVAASSQTLAGTITDNDGIRLVAASGKGLFEGGTLGVALEAVATTNGGAGYSKDADFAATLAGVSWSYQGGAAVAADFDTAPTSATFASGDASVDFVAASDGDAQESYSIKLAAVTGHTVVSGSNAVTGNIGPIVTAKWSAAAYSATEGGAARLTLTLDAPVVKDITVFIDTEDGSAASPGDFTSGGHSLSLSAGQSSAILSVALKQDSLAEGDETFDAMITGSDHPASVIIGDPDTAEVTIIDDEAGVRATPPRLTVAEGATGTYTVVLRTDPMGTVTVTPSSGDTSAATVSPASLTFDTSNWRTPKTVTVTGQEDANGIGETVVVDHAVSGYAGVTRAPSVTVVLTDNETLVPAVVVSRSRLTVTEAGPGTGTYTVRLNTNPGGAVTVTPSSDDTSAATVSGALTFTSYNWDEAQTVTVTAVDDSDMVGESVTVSHGVVGYSGVSSGPSVAVTLIDDDVVSAGVTVVPTALTVNEGASATYTVKLDAEPSDDVTVTVAGASGDVTVSGSPLTFTDQNYGTAQTITVSAASDEDATADAAVTLTHSATGGGYNGVTIDSVTVTVTETTPVLQLTTDPAAVTEGQPISLEVTSDKTVTGTLQVSLTLADRETSGFDADDIPGALTQTLTADFGQTASRTATISISTSTDSDVEGAETYTITLNDTAGYELGADKTAEGTLNDGTVSKPGRPTGLTATAGDKRVVLSWTDPDDDNITGYKLRYAQTADRGSATFSAISGSDGDTTTYTVTGLENGAEYSFRILATSAGGDGPASKWVKATPQAAATSTVSIPATLSVAENVGAATVRITTESAFGVATTFNVTYGSTASTSDTDATGASAPADGDYDNDAVTSVTFSASETTKDISIPITDDNVEEGAETFTVTIASAAALPDGFTLGNASTTVTITDNDTASLSIAAPSAVTEGDSGGTDMVFTVTLDSLSAQQVTVDYSVDSASTATSGTDHAALADGTLTFPAGAATQTITVSVTGDELDESDETVVIELSDPENAVLGTATATGTITDDDASPSLTAIADVSLRVGQTVDITASATDADTGDTISYVWTRKAGETAPAIPQGTALNQAKLTFVTASAGTYTMTVTASDGKGQLRRRRRRGHGDAGSERDGDADRADD